MATTPIQGRVALVTGAASGIGAASCRALADKGFTIVGVDVDDTRGAAVITELGGAHAYRHLDVSDEEAWAPLIAAVLAEQGRLDLVHLNAGVMSRPGGLPLMDDPLTWSTAKNFRRLTDINLGGTAYGVIAALAAPMLSHIIITASGGAILPLEMDPYYTMTKFGQLGLGLALEPTLAKRGVRLDVICPGAIDTGLTAPDIRAALKQERPAFIGESVATIATSDAPGPVWLAFSEAQGLQRYDVPGIPGSSAALDLVEQL